jgi:phage portal protein BeeE
LSADRTALWERVSKAPFLSVNEKRLAAGYGSIDGGDMFLRQYWLRTTATTKLRPCRWRTNSA